MAEAERRNYERSSSNTPAVIRSDDASFTASCVVSNLSEGGAKLLVGEHEPLPTQFILFLRPNSPVGRRCETIWRIGNKVGVRFVSTADSSIRGHKGSGVWAPE
jgi:PilZ domain-containing protein